MVHIFKKGDASICVQHRGLTVLGHFLKPITALIDAAINPAVEASLPHTQCGGRKGRSCSMVSLFSRSCLTWARAKGMSAFILFIDISTAFDSVIRELVLAADA